MADILLVEDKASLRQMLALTLETAGYTVDPASDGTQAIAMIERAPYHLVLTDLRMPHSSGLEVLRAARGHDVQTPVIVMTAYGSIDEAVQAMKDGAYDFLQKPVDTTHLLLIIERALEAYRLRRENVLLREESAARYGFPRIIGEAPALARAGRLTQQVAPRSTTVLLLGESGTGKELFARAIHMLSPRSTGPFVAVNCAAIPETLIENELFGHEKGAFTGADTRRPGKFELAHGGTLFLDEVGELPHGCQSKLLRALESGKISRLGGSTDVEVDVRTIAATNRDLAAGITARSFREDLYFRLAVFPITIPALRDRRSDIGPLASQFASRLGLEIRGRVLEISPAALTVLEEYSWPGNVRELENCIERACIIADGDRIEPVDIDLRALAMPNAPPEDTLVGLDLSGTLAAATERVTHLVERRKISEALEESGGNRTRAADILGVSTKTLLTKIRELGME
jgi:DNA-binding NtrC family response regulator